MFCSGWLPSSEQPSNKHSATAPHRRTTVLRRDCVREFINITFISSDFAPANANKTNWHKGVRWLAFNLVRAHGQNENWQLGAAAAHQGRTDGQRQKARGAKNYSPGQPRGAKRG